MAGSMPGRASRCKGGPREPDCYARAMNPPPLWQASVPVFLRYLERLRRWLDLAQAHAPGPAADRLLGARLADDMNPFATQVVIAANFALRACHPLAGLPVPSPGEPGAGFDGLRALVDRVSALVRELPQERFEGAESRMLESRAGDAPVRLPATEFLQLYALPNFFFHLTVAYAILRSRGVPIGKADFDGLHAYPPLGSDGAGAAEERRGEELREIERSRLHALVDGDMPLARRLHAPQFQLVTPAGRAFTRDEYLGKIERGELRYLRWEPGAIDVRLQADSAVLRYQATLAFEPDSPFRCWHIDTYERIDGRWQVVWSQATAIKA